VADGPRSVYCIEFVCLQLLVQQPRYSFKLLDETFQLSREDAVLPLEGASHSEKPTLRKKSPCVFNEISRIATLFPVIQGDSKLWSVFPWQINGNPDNNLESSCTCMFKLESGNFLMTT
jgi:hypothetical protein